MTLSTKAQSIIDEFDPDKPVMGKLKKRAAEIKTDHTLALEIWSEGSYSARLFAALIMDKAQLDLAAIEALADDLDQMSEDNCNRISEWLMANQLMKSAKTKALLENWADHPSAVLRRLYWYHQARLRWTGKIPIDNADDLMTAIEAKMGDEDPRVQWSMNFLAGWIGVFEPDQRKRVVNLGEQLGLYKDEKRVKGCTPNYLPEFVEVEVAKRV